MTKTYKVIPTVEDVLVKEFEVIAECEESASLEAEKVLGKNYPAMWFWYTIEEVQPEPEPEIETDWEDEEMETEDEMLAGMLTESGLEEKILTKIMNLTADQNEYDGDPELYELYYHNKQIEIETLQDVLNMMKGGDE